MDTSAIISVGTDIFIGTIASSILFAIFRANMINWSTIDVGAALSIHLMIGFTAFCFTCEKLKWIRKIFEQKFIMMKCIRIRTIGSWNALARSTSDIVIVACACLFRARCVWYRISARWST